ncbi:unnamed protein product, partial [Boreogadus saida]
MLVSYYHEDKEKVVVEHLGSLEVQKVTAASLEKSLTDFFIEIGIPWQNLVMYLKEVCQFMHIPATNPQRQHNVSEKAQQRIFSLHGDLNKKAMTQLGKDRKTRVNSKIWFEDTKTELQLSVYQGVLAILKEYVMVFQLLKTFLESVSQAYITTGLYLQNKLPLENPILQSLSAVDPILRGHSQAVIHLKKLATNLQQFTDPESDVHLEIMFEKNKQHDIRSFFSPGATGERKRKRTLEQHEEEEGRREEPVATEMGPAEEGDHDIADADSMETDFSPQVRRLRTP